MRIATPLVALLLLTLAVWPAACGNNNPNDKESLVEASAEPQRESVAEPAPKDAAAGDSTPEAAVDNAKPQRCEVKEPKDPNAPRPDYSQFNPTFGTHCDGTNHQDIKGVQKVVFVGDSITRGTPPTPVEEYYRNQLTGLLAEKFGKDIEIKDCSAWGARTDDLLLAPNQQLKECLPNATEPKTTLIVMTIGGNDMQGIAKKGLAGESLEQSNKRVEQAIKLLRDAIIWSTDKQRFPNGSFVLMGNVYEFTDGTSDLASCDAAKANGLSGSWTNAEKVLLHFNEQIMKIAVETKTDMIFMLERFCGHGFHRDDPNNGCYRGPDSPAWFDLTCIHPTPAGHTQIAKMFMSVVNE